MYAEQINAQESEVLPKLVNFPKVCMIEEAQAATHFAEILNPENHYHNKLQEYMCTRKLHLTFM